MSPSSLAKGLSVLLALLFLSACSQTAGGPRPPITSAEEAFKCERKERVLSTEWESCLERVFKDIPKNADLKTPCAIMEDSLEGDHSELVSAVFFAAAEKGAECDLFILIPDNDDYETVEYWDVIGSMRRSGTASAAYTGGIQPHEGAAVHALDRFHLSSGVCFFTILGNKGFESWFEELDDWAEGLNDTLKEWGKTHLVIKPDHDYLLRIFQDPKSCIVFVGSINQERTGKMNYSTGCTGLEFICLFTSGDYSVSHHGKIRGTSLAVTYFHAVIQTAWKRMPTGTTAKEVVELALQCSYEFGPNFTPAPGKRLDLWCLRQHILQSHQNPEQS